MFRPIVVFAVAIVVIAEVSAQRCGFSTCNEDQCCVQRIFCMPKGQENMLCGRCGCANGLECRSGRFGLMQCLKPESSSSTVTSIATDSSSSVTTSFSTDSSSAGTSVFTDSVSTDMSTEVPTTLPGN